MTITADDVAKLITARGQVPTDDQVEAQQEHFYPGTWRKHWPESLPLPGVLSDAHPGDGKRDEVTRSRIFERARSVQTEADALDLYVLMCGWGAGWQGLTGYRSRRPLRSPGIAAKLLASHQAIRSGEDPKSVYASLQPGGPNHIKYFGPAFFTKWLYFSGYHREGAGDRRPLILDARVARTLRWESWGWSSETYDKYLDLAAEAARQLKVGPQVIEYALYDMNGAAKGVQTDGDSRSLVIEDLPEAVFTALTTRAEQEQQPIQDAALELLTRAIGISLDDDA